MPSRDRFVRDPVSAPLPGNDADIAYASLAHLSRWIESRKLTSERLTQIYREVRKRYQAPTARAWLQDELNRMQQQAEKLAEYWRTGHLARLRRLEAEAASAAALTTPQN